MQMRLHKRQVTTRGSETIARVLACVWLALAAGCHKKGGAEEAWAARSEAAVTGGSRRTV